MGQGLYVDLGSRAEERYASQALSSLLVDLRCVLYIFVGGLGRTPKSFVNLIGGCVFASLYVRILL